MPPNVRLVKYSRLIGLIHRMTMMNGNTKLTLSTNWRILLSRQYFNESQCIRAMRRPGNVKMAPNNPHDIAMQNLTIILDAGPLQCNKMNISQASPSVGDKLTMMRRRALPGILMHFRWSFYTLAPGQLPMYFHQQSTQSWLSTNIPSQ